MLSELIFGKRLNEIAFSDLETFFSEEQEETSILEFKTGDVVIESIYKEVCAFLNTEGGVIIIGTPKEQKTKPSEKSSRTFNKGALTPSNFSNKDWLMQKIYSNISPSPVGINIQEFLTENGNYYIIDVAQSITPPHQCNNNGAYYIRMEREAKAAPHGIVEALFFRRQKPKLKLSFKLSLNQDRSVQCAITIGNVSAYPTEKVSYTVQAINVNGISPRYGIGSVSSTDETTYVLNYTSNQVLWKGLFLNHDFAIDQLYKPFYLSIMAWSRDAELITFVGIYDPATMKFIEKENNTSENQKGYKYYIELLKSL